MITPSFLQAGDTVGLIAPGYHIDPSQWEMIVPLLQSWGLRVTTGNSMYLQDGIFAGNDTQRLDDLVTMMCAPKIKAIICARGGYGSVRLLAGLESYSSAFVPKWLIGYSDVTVLAAYWVNRLQWQCIHGPMPVDLTGEQNLDSEQSWKYLHSLLFGEIPTYMLPAHELNRCGKVTAPLIGGNLSVICSLNATPYQWQTGGCILFIEDVNENLYHLDRMMINLRIGGQLSQLKGLLVGDMNGMHDSKPSFGKTAYEIIAHHVEAYDYPVVFGFPAGHDGVNYPLLLGTHTYLHVNRQSVKVIQTIVGNNCYI